MIVAYITDLFAQAKISRTAREAGVEIKVVSSLYKFLPEVESDPSAILVDLDAQGISPTSLIVQVKQRKLICLDERIQISVILHHLFCLTNTLVLLVF